MPRIAPEELTKIKEDRRHADSQWRRRLLVCRGTCCTASGGEDLARALAEQVAAHGLADAVQVRRAGCLGPCGMGPMVAVQPDDVLYQGVRAADAARLVEEHLRRGRVVRDLVFGGPESPPDGPASDAGFARSPFFALQRPTVLRNRFVIDPESLHDAIAADGYSALAQVLAGLPAQEVVEKLRAAGLRGRSGGGFPAARKWEECRRSARDSGLEPVIVCNGAEGDPGSYVDRTLLESDPHAVLEGMIIAARAIGARKGYVFIEHGSLLARHRLETAIDQARGAGFLGTGILGSDLDFDLSVAVGPDSYLCGEETALIALLEGSSGEPRPKYVPPARRGLNGQPTLIHNVETFANVPLIIRNGATPGGTKLLSLSGHVARKGVVEVALGTSVREVVCGIGGGVPGGRTLKAVLIGGIAGGCLPEALLDVPLDFEPLSAAGASMGGGGVIVVDDRGCMVDIARHAMEFLAAEACGKCLPCRSGLVRMRDALARIARGEGAAADLDMLERDGSMLQDSALCALGTAAPTMVFSTLRHFRPEFEAHLGGGGCPSGRCRAASGVAAVVAGNSPGGGARAPRGDEAR